MDAKKQVVTDTQDEREWEMSDEEMDRVPRNVLLCQCTNHCATGNAP